jgi:hypothetical protein
MIVTVNDAHVVHIYIVAQIEVPQNPIALLVQSEIKTISKYIHLLQHESTVGEYICQPTLHW